MFFPQSFQRFVPLPCRYAAHFETKTGCDVRLEISVYQPRCDGLEPLAAERGVKKTSKPPSLHCTHPNPQNHSNTRRDNPPSSLLTMKNEKWWPHSERELRVMLKKTAQRRHAAVRTQEMRYLAGSHTRMYVPIYSAETSSESCM